MEVIESLRLDPNPPGSIQLTSWHSAGQPVRRIKIGPYRVLYCVESNPKATILVLDIEHRKDVYR